MARKNGEQARLSRDEASAAFDEFIQQMEGKSGRPAVRQGMEWIRKWANSDMVELDQIAYVNFAARILFDRSLHKTAANSVRRKFGRIRKYLPADASSFERGTYVDFGAGNSNPIGLGLIFYLNGFERCWSVDLRPPFHKLPAALATYDLLASAALSPHKYAVNEAFVGEIEQRVKEVDADAFERGDFDQGLRRLGEHVHLVIKDIRDSGIAPGSVDLLTSVSVFEHVSNVESLIEYLHSLLRPGGRMLHFVDLRDHRAAGKGDRGYNAWTFLTEDNPPQGMNRVRCSEFLNLFEKHGFEMEKLETKEVDPPSGIRERLVGDLAGLDEKDLRTTNLICLLRKR